MFESLAIASNVPMTMPPVVAIKVSMMVNRIPSRNRYGSERMMTSQSKLANIVPASMRRRRRTQADEAGHRDAPFEPAHAGDDDDVNDDVNQGRAGEGLEHLEGKFRHRTRGRGKLDETNGQRDGGILDDVEKFRAQRWQDDAECHRQQDIAVGLRQRQSHRETC